MTPRHFWNRKDVATLKTKRLYWRRKMCQNPSSERAKAKYQEYDSKLLALIAEEEGGKEVAQKVVEPLPVRVISFEVSFD